jgi:hypothetical protein
MNMPLYNYYSEMAGIKKSNSPLPNPKFILFVILALIIAIGLCCGKVKAETIDLSIIAKIESENNPLAYNSKSGARGLYQITAICMNDYSMYHKTGYILQDLFNPEINKKIAEWYLNIRIPFLLSHYKQETSLDNILWAYNAGIGNLVKGIKPKETRNYILRYKQLAKGR